MPDYRRHRVAGATYFFTVNLLDRKSHLLTERIGARVRTLMPFHIDAWVVLPEHMHCLWTLPESDGNFPKKVAGDQVSVLTINNARRSPFAQSTRALRTRNLATALLGAYGA